MQMDRNLKDNNETKSPQEIEELRQRRLAYFESISKQSTNQNLEQKTSTKQDLINNSGVIELNSKNQSERNRQVYAGDNEPQNVEYNHEKQDEFRILKERIQEKSKNLDADGYNEEVENLIRLAKKEISGRYAAKNDIYDGFKDFQEIDEKGDNRKTVKYSDNVQTKYRPRVNNDGEISQSGKVLSSNADSVHIRKNENPTSHKAKHSNVQELFIDEIKPQRSDNRNIEELFSGRQPYEQQKFSQIPFKPSASESYDYESLAAFQKSLDTEAVDDLGLSTHRAESEGVPNNFADDEKVIEDKLREVSPRVFNEVTSDELRLALGERKYKEFLEKSLKEIDELHSGRSSDRSCGSKELNKKKFGKRQESSEKENKLSLSKNENPKSRKGCVSVDAKESLGTDALMAEKSSLNDDVESDFTKVTAEVEAFELKAGKGDVANTPEDQDNLINRPLLKRPKNERKNIYTPKRQNSENEKERNYEQLTVSRNVVFSANEIYSQAYKNHFPVNTDHFSSMPDSPHIQGQGHYMNPMYHSGNFTYGQSFIQSPYPPNAQGVYGTPSQSIVGPYGHPSFHSYPHPSGSVDMRLPFQMQGPYPQGGSEMEKYVQLLSARSGQSFDGSDFQRYPQYYSPIVPRPPETKPSQSEMKTRHIQNPQPKNFVPVNNFSYLEPHPPESIPPSARTSQPSEFTNYLQQMPKGIPYPPPPENVDLNAYFQYLSSQGYPVPYPRMMPSYPGPPNMPMVHAPPYGRMDSSEIYIDDKTKELNGPVMVPHPPPQKRDESSPRRNSKFDVSTAGHDGKVASKQEVPVNEHGRRDSRQEVANLEPDGKNSSQRHIEGVRQFHEQRRMQQEEDEVLQRQRTFAKASIDRYFNSLENLYKRDTFQIQPGDDVDIVEQEETPESKIFNESNDISEIQDGGETLVNTAVTAATSIKPGGITEREEKLGIDLSFVKGDKQPGVNNSETNNKSNGKLVIVCPECGEVNKPYMSWCADCGDVLIGINPILMKKGKNGKLKRCVTDNQEVQIENIKNLTIVEKDIEGEGRDSIPQIVTERDDLESPVHNENYKGKISPNKSDSRDSGRPSSEDMDYGRSEKEITDICENITDPVIKGFIKAYFSRKKQAVSLKEGRDSSASEKEDYENQTFEENSNIKQVVEEISQNQVVEEISHNNSHPDVISSKSEPVQHKQKSSRMKRKSKSNVPVDIEIFPSNERRSSSRTDPVVPFLNLVNSSDEEDSSSKPVKVLDSSTESNEWNEYFAPHQQSEEVAFEPQESGETEIEQQPFLAQVIADKPVPKPQRPNSGGTYGKRGRSSNVNSIVRESIESPGYQRHWARSSIAWSSYNQGELSTKSSLKGPSNRGRPSSASKSRVVKTGSVDNIPQETSSDRRPVQKKKQLNRPASADFRRPRAPSPQKSTRRSPETTNEPSPGVPVPPKPTRGSPDTTNEPLPGASVPQRPTRKSPELAKKPSARAHSPQKQSRGMSESANDPSPRNDHVSDEATPTSSNTPTGTSNVPDIPGIVDHRLPVEVLEETQNVTVQKTAAASKTTVEDAYMKYHEMTPRIREGELSMWLCFPDEIFLHILSFLPQADLAQCAQVCKTFNRVAMDQTLWKSITVKKKHNLNDESLIMIGRRHPVSLALIQCHGENVTARGLRELFRECGEYLRELNFFGCSRGALTGDCILLHASARCHNITHIDASWCNVTDSGIGAISESSNRLESLCINGCQMISDEGLETVIKKHGKSLRVLEMFGCFNITPKGIRYLGNHCINLITLNLGQCYKMTDSCITQLSSSLGKVETLDLRGCKNIKDNCMRYVVKNCPRLKTIVLANCPNISDVAILEISTYITDIRNIDVCGCRKITDTGVRALANNCQNLRYIDISSSGCSHRSVSMLANFCSQRLETVKLNFLSDVTEAVLIKLAKHCKRLKLLHLYGCTSVRLPDKIREVNPSLVVEM